MNIAINGFGRIGRLTFRHLLERKDINIVAINDLTDTKTLAHLLKYDSVHGMYAKGVESTESSLIIDGKEISVYSEKDPGKLPWKSQKADLIIECTGHFRTREKMQLHLNAGAKKILLSAPAKEGVKTIVLGVNDDLLKSDDLFISNASCTTNCLAPMAKILHDNFEIVKGYMTTVHSYTADQNLQDGPHKDLRRARAAALSIIPTTTGAAKALSLVIPVLEGKLDGYALRVPTPAGSITDLTVELKRAVTTKEINEAMKEASENHMKNILQYSTAPLVSADIIGNKHSCILDSDFTSTNENMAKVLGWYDNEVGYSARLADLAVLMAKM